MNQFAPTSSTIRLQRQPRVLEFGTQSMKFHSVTRQHAERVAYTLGRDVFTTGRISDPTTEHIIRTVRSREEKPKTCVATSGVRDARNRGEFVERLRDVLNLDVSVLSVREKSSLLVRSYLECSQGRQPALIADLGGGSLEIVYVGRSSVPLATSLPLGTIRLRHLGEDGWDEKRVTGFIDAHFRTTVLPRVDEIHAVGGIGGSTDLCEYSL